jgi:hypothetical protein
MLLIINGYRTRKDIAPERYTFHIQTAQSMGWNGNISLLWWDASSSSSLLFRTLVPFHWHKVKNRAERTGKKYFSFVLQQLKEETISVIAHSLGARVVYFGISEQKTTDRRIKDVILLGGAIRRNKREWNTVSKNISGSLINIYNQNDKVLNQLYKSAELRINDPIGLSPIDSTEKNIRNIYATDKILKEKYGSHTGYWKCLHLLHRFTI